MTFPFTVPASAVIANDNIARAKADRHQGEIFIFHPLARQRFSAHVGVSSAPLSLDLFPPTPALPPARANSSLLRSRRQNTFRRGTRIANLANYRKSCRAARAADPASTGAAPYLMHQVE